MIQVCSLCEKEYGQKPPYQDHSFTHGYCPPCAEAEMFKIGAQAMVKVIAEGKSFLDRVRLLRKALGVFDEQCRKADLF